jgi:hypothetical protein
MSDSVRREPCSQESSVGALHCSHGLGRRCEYRVTGAQGGPGTTRQSTHHLAKMRSWVPTPPFPPRKVSSGLKRQIDIEESLAASPGGRTGERSTSDRRRNPDAAVARATYSE